MKKYEVSYMLAKTKSSGYVKNFEFMKGESFGDVRKRLRDRYKNAYGVKNINIREVIK